MHREIREIKTDSKVRVPAGYYRAEGMIKNVNTIEEYRSLDKGSILNQQAHTVSLRYKALPHQYGS